MAKSLTLRLLLAVIWLKPSGFLARALAVGVQPVEITNGRARTYPRVLDELQPGAQHVLERYAKNPAFRGDRPSHDIVDVFLELGPG